MNKNNIKEIESYLNNYNLIKGRVGDLKLQIEELREEYEGLSSKFIGNGLSKTNKISSFVENEVFNRQERINFIEFEIKKKQFLLNRIDNAIDSLDEKDKMFVKLKYIEHKSNCDVAEALNLSVEYITEKRKVVLKNVAKIMG